MFFLEIILTGYSTLPINSRQLFLKYKTKIKW